MEGAEQIVCSIDCEALHSHDHHHRVTRISLDYFIFLFAAAIRMRRAFSLIKPSASFWL